MRKYYTQLNNVPVLIKIWQCLYSYRLYNGRAQAGSLILNLFCVFCAHQLHVYGSIKSNIVNSGTSIGKKFPEEEIAYCYASWLACAAQYSTGISTKYMYNSI